jgi:hypothetical protein
MFADDIGCLCLQEAILYDYLRDQDTTGDEDIWVLGMKLASSLTQNPT